MNNFNVKRTQVSKYPLLRPALFGFIVGSLSCFAVLLISAFLMTLKDIPEWSLGVITVLASSVGSLFGGFVCAYMFKKRGLFVGAMMGAIVFFVLFIIGCCCGAQPFTLARLASLVANLVFGSVGGVIGVNKVIKRKF